MAQKATVFKSHLQIADMDRGYYNDHRLTVAQHASETDERMMVRLLAFALHASAGLQFTKGLDADDEPDVWQKSLTDEIEVWIDVGLPDEKRIRKACGRAKQVYIYAYGGRAAQLWWEQAAGKSPRFENLKVLDLPQPATKALAELAQRSMNLQCTIQEGQVWVSDVDVTVIVDVKVLK